MECSNCGKDVPFRGKVCPYCNVDKSEDKFYVFAFWIGGVPGAITGGKILFSLFHNSVGASLVGMVVGVFAGALAIDVVRGLLRALLASPSSQASRKSHKDWTLEDKK